MTTYTFTSLDDPLGDPATTQAWDVNSAGEVVGTFAVGHLANGFLYNGSTFSPFNDPAGTNGTFANGINDAGQIVGSYRGDSLLSHGFIFSGGTFTPLDDPLD